jgi:ribose transport system substrate-binding protein
MHTKKWQLTVAAVLALSFAGLTGCASPDSGGADTGGTVEHRTIGWVDGVLAGSFQTRLNEVAAEAVDHLGWELKTVDLGGDPSKASSAVSGLVASQVDAILMSAVTPSTARAGLLEAQAAGIPVLIVGSEPGEEDLVEQLKLPYFGESESGLSFPLIDLMKEQLSPGDEVGVLYTTALASSTIRTDTVVKELTDAGFTVIPPVETGFDFADGQANAAALINQNPKMKTIVSIYDLWTAASVAAIKASGKDIHVYSYYADAVNNPLMRDNPDIVLGLADGDMLSSPLQAIDALLAHFQNGDDIDDSNVEYTYVAVQPDTLPPGDQNGPIAYDDALAPFYASWDTKYGVAAE